MSELMLSKIGGKGIELPTGQLFDNKSFGTYCRLPGTNDSGKIDNINSYPSWVKTMKKAYIIFNSNIAGILNEEFVWTHSNAGEVRSILTIKNGVIYMENHASTNYSIFNQSVPMTIIRLDS